MASSMSSIVQPNPAGSHMATAACCAREEAEKACQLADEQFLAGNIRGACRQARRAKRLCPSLPGVDNAVAAYDVHAAMGGGWRAILDLRPRRKPSRSSTVGCRSSSTRTRPTAPPPTKKKPRAAPGRQVFQCPALCPWCGAQYTSMVCFGQWCLQCKACSKAAMVDVQGPDLATATVRRRA